MQSHQLERFQDLFHLVLCRRFVHAQENVTTMAVRYFSHPPEDKFHFFNFVRFAVKPLTSKQTLAKESLDKSSKN